MVRRCSLMFALALGVSAFDAGPHSPSALAQQAVSPWCGIGEESVWVAPNAEQGDIARLTLQIRCVLAAPSYMRAKIETRCGRALCSWGWSDELAVDGLGLRAIFQTFSAERTVSMALNGSTLVLDVLNDFRREGRPDEALRTELGSGV